MENGNAAKKLEYDQKELTLNLQELNKQLKKTSEYLCMAIEELQTAMFDDVAEENPVPLQTYLDIVETDCIDAAMKKTKGNQSEAAELLGIKRTSLIEKIKRKRGIRVEDFSKPNDSWDRLVVERSRALVRMRFLDYLMK